MSIAVLSTGDELIHGDSLNTTGQVFAAALSAAGFPMGMHLMCGDKDEELMRAIAFLAAHHEALIITGGLGPTSDDRTRFALATHLGIELAMKPSVLAHIKDRIAAVNLKLGTDLVLNEGQRAQALFPHAATLFENPVGTAFGYAYAHEEQQFIVLPGPPKECLPMFDAYALPYLKQHLTPSSKVCLKWQLFGVPEGSTSERLEAVLSDLPCQVGYRLSRSEQDKAPYLEFKVRCEPDLVPEVRARIDAIAKPYASAQ